MKYDIGIIGGAGHIGFPLALAFASKKSKILIIDIDKKNIEKINKNIAPFKEENSKYYINKYNKYYKATINNDELKDCKYLIICVGNALNKHGIVDQNSFVKNIKTILKKCSSKQIIVIRSSVMPGTMKLIKEYFPTLNFAYCPERILQGKSLSEIFRLPQIISAFDKKIEKKVSMIFNKISKKIILNTIDEAELIKLFSNAYRYSLFAISNTFFQISLKNNLNFNNILKSMKDNYPRNFNIPSAGFAAGPCLEKDTLQIEKVFKADFKIGRSAFEVNHFMPNEIIKYLKKNYNLKNMNVGILGTAFKGNIDDERDSLSIDLSKKIKKYCKCLFLSDYFVNNKNYISTNALIKNCDIIIIGAPHKKYIKLKISPRKFVLDMWGIL